MRAFRYTIPNLDKWAICDTEIIVVHQDIYMAENTLLTSGMLPVGHVFNPKQLVSLPVGVHLIQESVTE
jgi:hypothetical protein